MWPSEPLIRPRAWLNNFDTPDKGTAAYLLDKFIFYNERLTNSLLVSSYHSIGDGLSKGFDTPNPTTLVQSLETACFTLVTGENPNPTDSGYTFCRKARQILDIPEELVFEPEAAIQHAKIGKTVVFLDDFIGSGDQFLKTWKRGYGLEKISFSQIQVDNNFCAIYLSLISTEFGIGNIRRDAPSVAVSVTHSLGKKYSIKDASMDESKRKAIFDLLKKYSTRLNPKEEYIKNNPSYLMFGYKNRGLMFGFQHSIPDATLPIFWAPGNNWEPLVERT